MTNTEETTFSNLAQRLVQKDSLGMSGFILSPIADALAKIWIQPTKPRVLALLAQDSHVVHASLEVNTRVTDITTKKPNIDMSANDSVFLHQANEK